MAEPPFDYGVHDAGRNLNYWTYNPPLQAEAARVYPSEEFDWAVERLQEFGDVVGSVIADTADVVDDNPPTLSTFDRDGDLVNEVDYHPAQIDNERAIYDRGIVADAFTAPPGRDEPVGLIHTLTLQLLLSYVDTGLVCSQSMTAGAALVLQNHDDGDHFQEYLDVLTAREYDQQIEGAMFLTERQGGSDVGAIETVASPVPEPGPHHPVPDDRVYRLTGEKWFCSNIDAQATLVLARRPDAPAGTAGLSMFLVPHHLPDGSLNQQRYRRLKDKLGTDSVPTGEVEFQDTTAYLVGEPERGFKYMTTMLNWERVTNAVGAVGIIARALLESKVKAANREVFDTTLHAHPLMQRDLLELTVAHEATLAFAMEAARWYDRSQQDDADQRAFRLMRILVPVAKHVTTRTAVDTASYAMEIQGGDGYVSDYITHRLYRDVQALPIWEGTANILSLDVLRSMDREQAHEALVPLVERTLDSVDHPYLVALATVVGDAFEALQSTLVALATQDPDAAQYRAKAVTESIYDVVTASLLLRNAERRLAEGDARKTIIAERFIAEAFSDLTVEDPDEPGIQYFDAIVRYATLDPERLPESPPIVP